jgi:hypothetical protein
MREVLGGYGAKMHEGLQLQAWNLMRRGAYYSCFDKRRLIYKTTNVLGQTGRCSLESFTAPEGRTKPRSKTNILTLGERVICRIQMDISVACGDGGLVWQELGGALLNRWRPLPV